MPATVTARYLGDPEKEKLLRARLQQLMEQYPGDWRVQLLGSQQNTIWEMTVTAPEGRKEWVLKLHGEDGGHEVGKILADLKNIVEGRMRIAKSVSK